MPKSSIDVAIIAQTTLEVITLAAELSKLNLRASQGEEVSLDEWNALQNRLNMVNSQWDALDG